MKSSKNLTAAVVAVAVTLGIAQAATAGSADKAASAHAAIGRYLEKHPEMIIDFSKVSGQYCVNTWKVKGGHMTHYAIDPSKTTEDVIDFVRVQPLIDAGIDVTKLPKLPSTLGKMKNGQWYYLAKGAPDPHHGKKESKFSAIVRATNIQ
jgi:hypothetical protein